jgi:hypothetical protein
MTLDDYPLDEEMLAFCKAAIENMPDALLVSGARKMPDLFKGLKQDKPNVEMLRQRVLAKLQLKTPPPPILDILRTATLSEALIDVLSEKALQQGLPALVNTLADCPSSQPCCWMAETACARWPTKNWPSPSKTLRKPSFKSKIPSSTASNR